MSRPKKERRPPRRRRHVDGLPDERRATDSTPMTSRCPPPQDNDKPVWDRDEGNLWWRGRLLLHLAMQAHSERTVLDALQELGWRFVVKNPLPCDTLGDKTASRRNAICNLMRHQGDSPLIYFFSVRDGFVAWCPMEWLAD